jgi:hypothetical protein
MENKLSTIPMISVITPSIRKEGLPLVEKALKNQTFIDWEWLICSSFDPKCGKWALDNFTGGFWTLNRAMNKLVNRANGELLVSIQDYTSFKPDALEKFWKHYQDNKKAIVSGVGNKYTNEDWIVKVWQDPRERDDQGSFYSTDFCNIEGNFCAIPKKAVYDIGGFDDQMDFLGFGMDFYGVVERIFDFGGYDFFLDQTNKSYSLPHSRSIDWDKYNLINGGYMERKKELIDKKTYPVLQYLQRHETKKVNVRHN